MEEKTIAAFSLLAVFLLSCNKPFADVGRHFFFRLSKAF